MANMEASFAGVQIQAQQYYYSKDGNLSKPVQRRRCPEEEDDDMPWYVAASSSRKAKGSYQRVEREFFRNIVMDSKTSWKSSIYKMNEQSNATHMSLNNAKAFKYLQTFLQATHILWQQFLKFIILSSNNHGVLSKLKIFQELLGSTNRSSFCWKSIAKACVRMEIWYPW
jgi:hypothetical protein